VFAAAADHLSFWEIRLLLYELFYFGGDRLRVELPPKISLDCALCSDAFFVLRVINKNIWEDFSTAVGDVRFAEKKRLE